MRISTSCAVVPSADLAAFLLLRKGRMLRFTLAPLCMWCWWIEILFASATCCQYSRVTAFKLVLALHLLLARL